MNKIIITTASNMSDETYSLLCEKAKARFGCEETEKRIDDSIIGGFVLNIDGLIYDASIKTQLDELKKHINA